MPAREIDITRVVGILRRETKHLHSPIVTVVSQLSHDPFRVLISCILSLRTKDQTTAKASQRLFKRASTPRSLRKLPLQTIQQLIYPVGFYRVKARVLKGIAVDLIQHFGGKTPGTLDTLLSLKGVGRKTANLVLTEGFGKPGICVDTHVHRISNRLGYITTKNPFETEMALRRKLPRRFWIGYNYLLVTWGQNICKPVSPLCSGCALARLCRRAGVRISR